MSCLFCGATTRKERKLCDVCLGLDESAQIDQAALAVQRILEAPPGKPAANPPKQARKPRKKETKPRKKIRRKRDPDNYEVIACMDCGSPFEKLKCQGLKRCDPCKEANKLRLERLREEKAKRAKRKPKRKTVCKRCVRQHITKKICKQCRDERIRGVVG